MELEFYRNDILKKIDEFQENILLCEKVTKDAYSKVDTIFGELFDDDDIQVFKKKYFILIEVITNAIKSLKQFHINFNFDIIVKLNQLAQEESIQSSNCSQKSWQKNKYKENIHPDADDAKFKKDKLKPTVLKSHIKTRPKDLQKRGDKLKKNVPEIDGEQLNNDRLISNEPISGDLNKSPKKIKNDAKVKSNTISRHEDDQRNDKLIKNELTKRNLTKFDNATDSKDMFINKWIANDFKVHDDDDICLDKELLRKKLLKTGLMKPNENINKFLKSERILACLQGPPKFTKSKKESSMFESKSWPLEDITKHPITTTITESKSKDVIIDKNFTNQFVDFVRDSQPAEILLKNTSFDNDLLEKIVASDKISSEDRSEDNSFCQLHLEDELKRDIQKSKMISENFETSSDNNSLCYFHLEDELKKDGQKSKIETIDLSQIDNELDQLSLTVLPQNDNLDLSQIEDLIQNYSAQIENLNSSLIKKLNSSQSENSNLTQNENLNSSQIEDLNSAQNKNLNSPKIENLISSQIENLNSAQIENLNSSQTENLNSAQIENFNSSQIEKLNSSETENSNLTQTENLNLTKTENSTQNQNFNSSQIEKLNLSQTKKLNSSQNEKLISSQNKNLNVSQNKKLISLQTESLTKPVYQDLSQNDIPKIVKNVNCKHRSSAASEKDSSNTEEIIENSFSSEDVFYDFKLDLTDRKHSETVDKHLEINKNNVTIQIDSSSEDVFYDLEDKFLVNEDELKIGNKRKIGIMNEVEEKKTKLQDDNVIEQIMNLEITSKERSTNNESQPKMDPKINGSQFEMDLKNNESQLKMNPKINESQFEMDLKNNESQFEIDPKNNESQFEIDSKNNESQFEIDPKINELQLKMDPKNNESQLKIDLKNNESQLEMDPKNNESNFEKLLSRGRTKESGSKPDELNIENLMNLEINDTPNDLIDDESNESQTINEEIKFMVKDIVLNLKNFENDLEHQDQKIVVCEKTDDKIIENNQQEDVAVEIVSGDEKINETTTGTKKKNRRGKNKKNKKIANAVKKEEEENVEIDPSSIKNLLDEFITNFTVVASSINHDETTSADRSDKTLKNNTGMDDLSSISSSSDVGDCLHDWKGFENKTNDVNEHVIEQQNEDSIEKINNEDVKKLLNEMLDQIDNVENKPAEENWPRLDIKIGDQCLLTSVQDPSLFYIILADNILLHHQFHVKLKEFAESNKLKSVNSKCDGIVSKENIFLVVFNDDHKITDYSVSRCKIIDWYLTDRAKDNVIYVFGIDEGFETVAQMSNLKFCPEEFILCPPFAQQASLKELYPYGSTETKILDSWNEKAIGFIKSQASVSLENPLLITDFELIDGINYIMLKNKMFSFDYLMTKTFHAVHLPNVLKSKTVPIKNDQFQKQIIKAQGYSKNQDQDEVWQDLTGLTFPSEKEAVDEAISMNDLSKDLTKYCRFTTGQYKQCWKTDCKLEHRFLNQDGFTLEQIGTFSKTILQNPVYEPGYNLLMISTCIPSVTSFYAYRIDDDTNNKYTCMQNEIRKNKKLLKQYKDHQPAFGELLLVKYEDKFYLRGQLLNINDDNLEGTLYQIQLIDYGSVVDITIDNIFLIEEKYIHLPPRSQKFRIDKLKNRFSRNEDFEKSREYLEKLILNQKIQVEIRGRKNETHFVDIYNVDGVNLKEKIIKDGYGVKQ